MNCSSHECEYESDSCFVHIDDRSVRRGCVKESIDSLFTENGINLIDDCRDKFTCQLCSDRDNCNDMNIIVESCIECHTDANLNCTYEPNKEMSKTCPLTVIPSGCYLRKSGLSNIQRGCLSNLDENERGQCLKDPSICKTCVGNDCNMEMKFQSCYICDSSVDGEKCRRIAQDTKMKLCRNYLSECFISVENNTILRGCLGEEMPAESCISRKCKTCSRVSDCNRENIQAEMCIACDSETDSTCQKNATPFANQTCALSVNPEGCYHQISVDGRHERGNFFFILHSFFILNYYLLLQNIRLREQCK